MLLVDPQEGVLLFSQGSPQMASPLLELFNQGYASADGFFSGTEESRSSDV